MTFSELDLRTFLDQLADRNKTQSIGKPVCVATEVAALCSESERPLLFENLKGFEGWRLADRLGNISARILGPGGYSIFPAS